MDDTTAPATHRAARARRSRGSVAVALAVPVGVLASGALVWQASYAAFTDTATNPGNSWSTGTVALTESGNGSAVFAATGLEGGQSVTQCITVTYTGSIAPVDVTFAVAGVDGTDTLAPYLALDLEEATGTCASPGVYSAPVTVDPLADGALGSTWSPAATNETRAYRFTATVAADDAAQGLTATADLVWTATS